MRIAPHRKLAEVPAGMRYFPRSLMPYLDHPVVAELPDELHLSLGVWHLYAYLDSVANLESKVVNRATLLVADDGLGLGLPAEVRLDAWKIYCDEAHHAMSNFDLVCQVERKTGVPHLPYTFAPVMGALTRATEPLRADAPGLGRLLEAVIFETVVTSLLETIPRSAEVVPTVRDVVADHARDERLHHAFYTIFFDRLWGGLEPAVRERVARVLPALVRACLATDTVAHTTSLRAAGLTAEQAEQVLAETYTPRFETDQIRQAARRTLRMFAEHDVFDHPGARESFEASGLLIGEI